MRKIQSIKIISGQGVSIINIGDNINGLEVEEIKENSKKWENGIDRVYSAVDEYGLIIREIINCPVDVIYHETNVCTPGNLDSVF